MGVNVSVGVGVEDGVVVGDGVTVLVDVGVGVNVSVGVSLGTSGVLVVKPNALLLPASVGVWGAICCDGLSGFSVGVLGADCCSELSFPLTGVLVANRLCPITEPDHNTLERLSKMIILRVRPKIRRIDTSIDALCYAKQRIVYVTDTDFYKGQSV